MSNLPPLHACTCMCPPPHTHIHALTHTIYTMYCVEWKQEALWRLKCLVKQAWLQFTKGVFWGLHVVRDTDGQIQAWWRIDVNLTMTQTSFCQVTVTFVRVRFLQQTNSANKITVIAAIGKNTLDINYIHLADPAQNSTQFEHNDDHNNGCKILIIVITNIHMYLRTFCKDIWQK